MDQKPNIELEKLLKLKKFEKPDPEFWDEFDHGLRRKSMEALSEQRGNSLSSLLGNRMWQQLSVVAALVVCGVPAFLGFQSLYVKNDTIQETMVSNVENTANVADRQVMHQNTQELLRQKNEIGSMNFVVDSYTINPSDFTFTVDNVSLDSVDKRVYISDSVKAYPADATLPAVRFAN